MRQPNVGELRDVLTPEAAFNLPHEEELRRRQELLAKVKNIRDAILVNRGKVEGGDPNKTYVWVNNRAERRMWFETTGWSLVTALTDPDVMTQYKREDGTHVRGDLILYSADKEYAEMYHYYDVLKGMEMLEGAKDTFRTVASQQGIPTFVPKI